MLSERRLHLSRQRDVVTIVDSIVVVHESNHDHGARRGHVRPVSPKFLQL